MLGVDGVLIIDKPAGPTSHDVVARVRRIVGERRVGHTGTLDPFATGVLVILVGRTTRLAQFLSYADKEYEAVVRLGYETDTGDRTGNRIADGLPPTDTTPGKEEIQQAIDSLRGEIAQTPPMFSAKKIGGRKLYELARTGTEVERQPVTVNIAALELLSIKEHMLENEGVLDLSVRVTCSAGTYIRVLAEDLGKRLGRGAHLAALRRTRAGRFPIDAAVTLEQLEELTQAGSLEKVLRTPDEALSHLPCVDLSSDESRRVAHGIDLEVDGVRAAEWPATQAVRIRQDGRLVAVGIYNPPGKTIHPKIVLQS
jgi:tRNA pseudouridine55 synthase